MQSLVLIAVLISVVIVIASGIWVALALVRALTARQTSDDTQPQSDLPNTEKGPQV